MLLWYFSFASSSSMSGTLSGVWGKTSTRSRVKGLGFGVCGLGFRVWGLGFGV